MKGCKKVGEIDNKEIYLCEKTSKQEEEKVDEIISLVSGDGKIKYVERFVPIPTRGFVSEIPPDLQAKIYRLAMSRLSPKTDFIVFRNEVGEPHYEDEGRTYVFYLPELPKKVYVKLDDYGSPEILSKCLGHPTKARYVATFMLAEEY